ncbi:MAG: peptidase [Ferruginibacter sp.]|nr:peptidase [Ferruginibacter sp.]
MQVNRPFYLLILFFVINQVASAQFRNTTQWTADGNGIYQYKEGNIVKIDIKTQSETPVIKKSQLVLRGGDTLMPEAFNFSSDHSKLLLFTNTAKVWRYNTRGDYWILDITTNKLKQLGKGRPAQSLMYAKFSPDGRNVAYVSGHNLFVEALASNIIKQLTLDGTRKLINGTFDWVYEEEFGCRDGFRWSPDGSKIAYWQVDATKIPDYYMLNTTDSNYSQVIPVEYPKVGEAPSPVKIGVVSITGGVTKWMHIAGDPQQHYLPRMEWSNAGTLIVQQLDRRQQQSELFYCNVANGSAVPFYAEKNNNWIEVKSYWNDDDPTGWEWINEKKAFIWVSEKDGWRHLYKVSSDGKKEELITKGKYDIASIECIDETSNYIYFMASPSNATQLYLFRIKMDGKSDAEPVSNLGLKGTHHYVISPGAKWAKHSFSNYFTPKSEEWVNLPLYIQQNNSRAATAINPVVPNSTIQYTTVTIDNGVELDAWINRPKNFDSTKKYPVVFYVYGEPASSTVADEYGNHQNYLYNGDMSEDGYFQVAIDNRGTPSLKGAAWRKAIYRKIGTINIADMAMAAKKILAKPYFDKDRVAVWGWSGGGSSTLNLMFQFPEIFKTGIAIAAVTNQLFYDNIYQERYMGLPQENKEDFIKGSPVTYAKNLKGKLLYIHGTGDDNVHYSNAELLLNELVKYNKQFRFMAYPNRTHGLREGEGTGLHLVTLYTSFLRENCPPGAR